MFRLFAVALACVMYGCVPAPEPVVQLGDNSCRWSYDGACDERQYAGTGACAPNTDAYDCAVAAQGGNDSCDWSFDGECDEPVIGRGLCQPWTDVHDCRSVAYLRGRTNTCTTSYNGVCDEPGQGSGSCAALTDTADCTGRDRPNNTTDHFFGTDDRILVDADDGVWRAIGTLESNRGRCTAVLVADNIGATAAHCFYDRRTNRISVPRVFLAGRNRDGYAARSLVTRYYVSPEYPILTFADRGDGDDWAFFELADPIGRERGHMAIIDMTDEQRQQASDPNVGLLLQAGYSRDTGDHLSAHVGCFVHRFMEHGSFLHRCDTTQGDSGSPIFMEQDGQALLIGIDSRSFFGRGSRNLGNLATDGSVLLPAFNAFVAGATTGGRSVAARTGGAHGWVSLD